MEWLVYARNIIVLYDGLSTQYWNKAVIKKPPVKFIVEPRSPLTPAFPSPIPPPSVACSKTHVWGFLCNKTDGWVVLLVRFCLQDMSHCGYLAGGYPANHSHVIFPHLHRFYGFILHVNTGDLLWFPLGLAQGNPNADTYSVFLIRIQKFDGLWEGGSNKKRILLGG